MYNIPMAKVKKKRNKKYTGADAAATRPTITRVQAVNRGKLGQWLFENQKMLKMIRNVLLIGLVVAIIISGIIIAAHWFTFYQAIKVSNVSITLACLSTGAFFASILEPIFYKRKVIWYELLFFFF